MSSRRRSFMFRHRDREFPIRLKIWTKHESEAHRRLREIVKNPDDWWRE